MAEVETTWKILFDGPQGLRVIVEYHSEHGRGEHKSVHDKLVKLALQLLALHADAVKGRPVRLVPIQLTQGGPILYEPIPVELNSVPQ